MCAIAHVICALLIYGQEIQSGQLGGNFFLASHLGANK
jgi:hypothetical protein